MTASPGREVDANLLRGAALVSAHVRANAKDAGGQDRGKLGEPLGRGHQIGVESVAASAAGGWRHGSVHATTIAPLLIRKCRDLRRFCGGARA
jgi:hypothetical protein